MIGSGELNANRRRQTPTQAFSRRSAQLRFGAITQIEMIETLVSLGAELLDKNRVLVRDGLDLFSQTIPLDGLVVPHTLCARFPAFAQAIGKFPCFFQSR